MNKIIILFSLLILVSGCDIINEYIRSDTEPSPFDIVGMSTEEADYFECKWGWYEIEYVDEIDTSRCYACELLPPNQRFGISFLIHRASNTAF